MLNSLRSRSPLSTVLWADVGLELLVAALCFALAGPASRWFDLEQGTLYVAGAVFLVAGIALIPLARKPAPSTVTPLAWANIIGGAAAWLVLVIAWSSFEPEGRWVLAAIADSFIAIGALELLALRRSR